MRISIIGMGFMGGVHLNAWQQVGSAEVVAVCDTNRVIGKTEGNIDAGPNELNLEGIAIYTDIAEMLSSESPDAVSIALPTHLHKPVSIQCLEAGAHVLCEKPMALNPEDCAAIIKAAEAAGKELMIAHCIRFWPEYVWLKSAVDCGTYGKVTAAEFDRRTYAPAWSDDSWFADTSLSGGIALDLHIHDLDYIQYLFGSPEHIKAQKACFENDVAGHIQTWMDYGPDFTVSATASWMMPETYGFSMGYNVMFEKAAAVFDGTRLQVFPDSGDVFEPELLSGDGYLGEVKYFADRIEGTASRQIITPQQAAESVRIALEAVKQ